MTRASRNDGNNTTTTLDTINAAAFAIASAHNRDSQPSLQKKRWGSWLSITGCFGYHKNQKRIGHAVLVPEPTPTRADPATVSSTQAPTITLPFVAPPSSPASLFQSEPPSTAQSPVGMISLTSVSASMYSPGGPASIFAIGPYAHETQLVSPPVFSASSTAPFTPPPESVHLTTPSSPEVPFAQLLNANNKNAETYQRIQISHYDFQSYQFHPGSPVGQLISPRSAISASGTSSPLPDYENLKSNQGSGSLTPDALRSGFLPSHWVSEIKMSPSPTNNRPGEYSINHRVSFELSTQKVVDNKPASSTWTKVMSKLKQEAATREDKQAVAETPNDAPKQATMRGDEATVHENDQSLTLSSSTKEFNFDNNADGGDSQPPNIVADWWANEKVAGKERRASKDWSFFPVIQTASANQ